MNTRNCGPKLLLMLALLFFGINPAARANGGEAAPPLVSKRLDRLFSGWRPLKPGRAYLIVTATGASTDVLVVAPNNVPPPALAGAVTSALAGTPLRGRAVEWSGGDWSAAHARLSNAQPGAWKSVNAVPFGILADGMCHAGIRPVPVLCLPDTAFVARLPEPFHWAERVGWYDVGPLRSGEVFRVREAVSPADVLTLLLPFLVIPVLGWGGLRLAARGLRPGEPTAAERKRYDAISSLPVMVALLVWMFWLAFNGGTPPALLAVGDVWFGAASVGAMSLFMVWFVAVLLSTFFVSLAAKRQEVRLFGPDGIVPASAMSPEERVLRTREGTWQSVVPMLAIVAVLFVLLARPGLVPPSLARGFFPLVLLLVTLPLGLYFHRRARVFTQEAPDAVLTDQVRRTSARPGLPPPEVIVERSARASAFAFLEGRPGGRILVSQKLAESAAPGEMAFLLAQQAALARTPDPFRALGVVVPIILLLALLAPGWLTRHSHGGVWLTLGLMLGAVVLTLWLVASVLPRREVVRLQAADQIALAETGDRDAALSALELLRRHGAPAKGPGNPQGALPTQIAKRLTALGSVPVR